MGHSAAVKRKCFSIQRLLFMYVDVHVHMLLLCNSPGGSKRVYADADPRALASSWLERRIHNPKVASSILPGCSPGVHLARGIVFVRPKDAPHQGEHF